MTNGNDPHEMLLTEYWSENRELGLALGDDAIRRFIHFAHKSERDETGGILVGYYDQDFHRAVVTAVSGPPKDSKGGPTWFARGTKGLASWLQSLWTKHRHFYIGEWHYHPSAAPLPSGTDIETMIDFSKSSKFRCPEPLLIIVGGRPEKDPSLGAYLFSKDGLRHKLLPDRAVSIEPYTETAEEAEQPILPIY